MLASEELGMRNSSEYRLEMIDDEDDEDYETVLLHPLKSTPSVATLLVPPVSGGQLASAVFTLPTLSLT